MDNILELNAFCYDVDKSAIFTQTRYKSHQIKQLNQLNDFFTWKSNTEKVTIPRNFEILLRVYGVIGFMLEDKKFAHIRPVDFDDENNPAHYVAIGFGTNPKSYGNVEAKALIPLFNNPLGLSDLIDINYFAYEKSQNDISRMYQLLNSRLIPILQADTDQAKQAAEKALNEIKAGKPSIFTTSLFDEIKTLDILDPNNIEKMQYLTSYDEVLDKNIANHFGMSLDVKNKAAQVNTAELKAYDDITTSNYLVNYECRLEFVEKMKDAGFDIDCIVSPVFADEPNEEEIEEPELLEEETPEEMPAEEPEEEKTEESEGEEDEKNND